MAEQPPSSSRPSKTPIKTPSNTLAETDANPVSAALSPEPDYATGAQVIKNAADSLPASPGVYRMLSHEGEILYVGKAHQLARRVLSYSQPNRLSSRLMRMVSETKSLEVTHTNTEVEALLLEQNLIKQHRPRFNILLKDDKNFAHILLTRDHPFGQLTKHRGSQKRKGDYFGPFASTSAVNRTVTTLTRAFMLRTCSDAIYSARTRPCLQYQIKRCTAPCVGKVSEEEYGAQMRAAHAFLSGRSDAVQKEYAQHMQEAAETLNFEEAALWRNRIRALTAIQANQDIHLDGLSDADVLGLSEQAGKFCIQVFFIRAGTNYGNKAFFPKGDGSESPEAMMAAFIGQFYEDMPPPKTILVSHLPEEAGLIQEALSLQAGRKTEVSKPARGGRRSVMELALKNAEEALARQLADRSAQTKLLDELAQLFDIDTPISRVEIYDNSHIQGSHAIGAMVAAGPEGFIKSGYRIFNIRKDGKYGVQDGDDFGMMRQMIFRRFERALREDPERKTANWPQLLLIDGGRGQLNAVLEVLAELELEDIRAVGVSKGPERNAGREQFHMEGSESFTLPFNAPAMHFLQRLRDESHRFAIGSHRARRTKATLTSPLDGVPGIGPKRKKALLTHFGSARSVARAGMRDLMAVDGISEAVAQQIYDWFHNGQGS